MTTLTPLALENADVLRALTGPSESAHTFAAFAQLMARDPSNLRKTLQRLEAEGMAARDETAPTGWRADPVALDALDRLEGLATAHPGSAHPGESRGPDRWPHDDLTPDPMQPRKAFDFDALADLARSIAGAGDVLTPLLVLPPDASGARIIKAGERRWRAVGLLSAGVVPGCVLPPALDPAAGGGLPIREVQPSPGDTAWIALTENGNREPLNAIEDGEALLALMTERGWSAREAAHQLGRVGKTTGQPGAGSDGVKTVQERVKVAREATAQNKARFLTDPDFTWKDLLATVQAAKPAAEAAPAPDAPDAAPIGQRPGDFIPLTPEVIYDIEAMGWGLKGLSARIELARDPEGGWRFGYDYQTSAGGGGKSPGHTLGEGSAKWSRQRAFDQAEATLRHRAAGWQGSLLPLAVRLLQWLDALGDGTSDPANIPPRKPTTWDAEAARIARGEGGASGPAKAKSDTPKEPIREAGVEAAPPPRFEGDPSPPYLKGHTADTFEEDDVPPYLRRLAGGGEAQAVEEFPADRLERTLAAVRDWFLARYEDVHALPGAEALYTEMTSTLNAVETERRRATIADLAEANA